MIFNPKSIDPDDVIIVLKYDSTDKLRFMMSINSMRLLNEGLMCMRF